MALQGVSLQQAASLTAMITSPKYTDVKVDDKGYAPPPVKPFASIVTQTGYQGPDLYHEAATAMYELENGGHDTVVTNAAKCFNAIQGGIECPDTSAFIAGTLIKAGARDLFDDGIGTQPVSGASTIHTELVK